MIRISETDRKVLNSLNAQAGQVAQELGVLRVRYLAQESDLARKLSTLEAERDNMIRRVAAAYIPDGESLEDWTFDMGTLAFRKINQDE